MLNCSAYTWQSLPFHYITGLLLTLMPFPQVTLYLFFFFQTVRHFFPEFRLSILFKGFKVFVEIQSHFIKEVQPLRGCFLPLYPTAQIFTLFVFTVPYCFWQKLNKIVFLPTISGLSALLELSVIDLQSIFWETRTPLSALLYSRPLAKGSSTSLVNWCITSTVFSQLIYVIIPACFLFTQSQMGRYQKGGALLLLLLPLVLLLLL